MALVLGASMLGAVPPPASATTLEHEIRAAASGETRIGGPFPADREWLQHVYAIPEPVWFTSTGGPRPSLDVAIESFASAREHGLDPADYGIPDLMQALHAAIAPAASPHAVARADTALTATMLRFLSDLRFGRVRPEIVEPHYRPPARTAPFVSELREAVASSRLPKVMAAAEPRFPLYARLTRLLADYRRLDGAWPALGLPEGKVVAGDAYAEASALRARLVQLGDLEQDAVDPAHGEYTANLAAGVIRFQRRHGLAADGVLGRETIAALNVKPAARVKQIELSMERLRWVPELRAGPLVAINIPSYQLWAFSDATDAASAPLSMAVIVGKAMRHETPVFLGEMRGIEFSPYWNVPSKIMRNEYLGRLARDPALLAREDMELVTTRGEAQVFHSIDDGALKRLADGSLRLRQRPGRKNALGGIKFVLPNTMDIYLHATPARALFEHTRRDFSHGCIRLRQPAALAQFALRDRPEWNLAAIEAAMNSGVNTTVPLVFPIPVIVFYTTAIVDSDGRAHFLADVYRHDDKLRQALERPRPPVF